MNTAGMSNLHPYQSWRGTDASAAMPLKALSPFDLGTGDRTTAAETKALRPLAFTDFIPGSRTTVKTPHEQLVENTQKWVAQTFYGTILKQMHDSPFKSELFSGGRGGEAFSGLMDQHLTERMARAANNKLVKGIVRRIEARQAYAKQKATKEGMDATEHETESRGDRGNGSGGAAANAVPAALRA